MFPAEPWGEEELADIANTVENFMLVENVMDDDPWVDWLDRWKFYQSLK